MVAIRCPYCQYQMELKGAKPGLFHPRCGACHEKFALVIPDDPAAPPATARLAGYGAKSLEGARSSLPETVPPVIGHALGLPDAAPAQGGASPTIAPIPASTFVGLAAGPSDYPPPGAMPGPAPAPQNDLSGRLDGYELLRKLGQGGMGSVYLARQLS